LGGGGIEQGRKEEGKERIKEELGNEEIKTKKD
jgi:hypothetical protein